MKEPKIGIIFTREQVVEEKHLASRVGSGSVDVLATPMVAALMEGAAADLAQSFLDEGLTTVGSKICVEHLCPTAQGVKVTAQAELTGVDGRVYRFALRAFDNAGQIAAGTHERVSVKRESFARKAQERKESVQ